jgi:hypothetical protein
LGNPPTPGQGGGIEEKQNEISSKTSSFSIFNSVDPHMLESVALGSNINLENNALELAKSISVIQANGHARVALMAAKKKIIDQAQKENIVCSCRQPRLRRRN